MIKFDSVNHFYNSYSASKGIQVKNTVNTSTKLVSGMKLVVHAHRFENSIPPRRIFQE
jgi:hypothetical protein